MPAAAAHRPRQSRTFCVRRPEKISGRRILLADDVFTADATLRECAGMSGKLARRRLRPLPWRGTENAAASLPELAISAASSYNFLLTNIDLKKKLLCAQHPAKEAEYGTF
jgi:hypothetical protein